MIYLILILGIGLSVFLDQYTKYLAAFHLEGGSSVPIIKDVFELDLVHNDGAAWGILEGQMWLFFIIGAVMLCAISIIYMKIPQTKRMIPLRICMIFIASGAIGNIIDRIRLNYVIDFLYFKLINFPVFNVADIYVSVATIVLAILLIFYYKDEEVDMVFQTLSFRKKNKQE